VELSPDAPIWHLGAEAIGALRRHASSCAVTDWVLGSTDFNKEVPKQELQESLEQFQFASLSLEQYVAGGIIRQLMLNVGPSNPELQSPSGPPSDEHLQSAIDKGVEEGLSALKSQLSSEAELFSKLLANNFRLK
jgi:hypothetical protein